MAAKTLVLGITGSIAAYKACDIISRLRKQDVQVRVILTKAGSQFITPLALETRAYLPCQTGGRIPYRPCFRQLSWEGCKRHCR